jgi:hypothetical protein
MKMAKLPTRFQLDTDELFLDCKLLRVVGMGTNHSQLTGEVITLTLTLEVEDLEVRSKQENENG